MLTATALDLLAALVMPDGRRWGEIAERAQWEDARSVLDETSSPYSFLTRSRGRSKTTDLAAMLIGAMVEQLPRGARCYGIAADRDQGRLVLDSFRGFVERTPSLQGRFEIGAFRATDLVNGSTFEVLAADAAGSWGLRPDFVIIDEIAQWPSTSQPRQVFEAITSAVAKVVGSRMVLLTSAGDPAHWSFKILEHARRDPMWRVHEVIGPAPWISKDRLEEQRRRLPESSFQRLFMNQWTASEDRLTSLDDLMACVSLDGPLLPTRGIRYVVGLDIGLKHDRTVAAVCHAEEDNREPGLRRVIVDRIESWQGSRKIPVRLDTVEAWLLQASRQYNRAAVIFDPWQAVGLVQRLRDSGVACTEFTFSSGSVGRLASTLHLALRNHSLALPNDEALLDELSNIRLRETSPGVLRLDHDPGQHDDRAIALALCVQHLSLGASRPQAVNLIEIVKSLEDRFLENDGPVRVGAGDSEWDW